MKKFFYSKWFLILFCVIGVAIIGIATYFTPNPYTFIPPLVLSVAMGAFIRWWLIKYLENRK